jgi:hypothetical protein
VSPPPSYCSLDEYVRMLIFEAPLPIRRLRLAVTVLLPGGVSSSFEGSEPRQQVKVDKDNRCRFYLPPPTELPVLQFDVMGVLDLLPPPSLLRYLAAVAQSKTIAVVANSAQRKLP